MPSIFKETAKSKKYLSNNIFSKYMKDMEKLSKLAKLDHQNAIVFSILIEKIKVLEKKLDDLNNHVNTIFFHLYTSITVEDKLFKFNSTEPSDKIIEELVKHYG